MSSDGENAQGEPDAIVGPLTTQHDISEYKKRIKERYAFWETQPVVQFTGDGHTVQASTERC